LKGMVTLRRMSLPIVTNAAFVQKVLTVQLRRQSRFNVQSDSSALLQASKKRTNAHRVQQACTANVQGSLRQQLAALLAVFVRTVLLHQTTRWTLQSIVAMIRLQMQPIVRPANTALPTRAFLKIVLLARTMQLVASRLQTSALHAMPARTAQMMA